MVKSFSILFAFDFKLFTLLRNEDFRNQRRDKIAFDEIEKSNFMAQDYQKHVTDHNLVLSPVISIARTFHIGDRLHHCMVLNSLRSYSDISSEQA